MLAFKALAVSTGRWDVSIQLPLWHSLLVEPHVECAVFMTGAHSLSNNNTLGIDWPTNLLVYRGGEDLGGEAGQKAARAIARISDYGATVIDEFQPDVLIVTGDRLDMIPVVLAALPYRLPVVHLHGGEETLGAIDNRVRHSVSQMADLHCVSSQASRDRLLSMGIDCNSIVVTGAPGLDTLRKAEILSRDAFFAEVGLLPDVPFRLVTLHPETMSADPCKTADETLAALAEVPQPTLFTAPNSDPGGKTIHNRILQQYESIPGSVYIETLGTHLYPSALQHAELMVGNSSSGIIEAGLFGLPVVNIGTRQKGRERGTNVIDVGADRSLIKACLTQLGTQPNRSNSSTPYGDGHSGPRIAKAILQRFKERDTRFRSSDSLGYA